MTTRQSKLKSAGLRSGHLSRARLVASLLLLAGLVAVGPGCGSIYHRTRALLPPEPCAQLKLRMSEAQRAEKLAQQAGITLRNRLDQGLRGDAIEIDVDRVEAAAFEFARRVASAQDAAKRCAEQNQLAAELERLGRRSREFMECGQSLRRAAPAVTAERLNKLLRDSGKR